MLKAIIKASSFLLAFLAAGQIVWAQSEFSISEPTYNTTTHKTTFTITRTTNTSTYERLLYRTVSLSAIAGQHFTDVSGELYFNANHNAEIVEVTELPGNSTDAYHFQTDAARTYRLEVLDPGGFRLVYKDRNITNDLTGIDKTRAFGEQVLTIKSEPFRVTDGGYAQAYHSLTVSDYYTAAAPKDYLVLAGASLRMTVTFDAHEEDDGYQYVQIYANTPADKDHTDTGAGNGIPGNYNFARYVAGFSIGGNESSTYYPYTFPVTAYGHECGYHAHPWSGNPNGNLEEQYFQSNCRASDGRLIVPTELTSLYVRLNASGNVNDDWYCKNLKARIQAVDGTVPTRLAADPVISDSKHAKGNTFYVTIPFSEIVKVTGTPTLSTTWGSLSYSSGDGSNVLTFSGTITAKANTSLTVQSISGTITDLAGNVLNNSYKTINKDYEKIVDGNYGYNITYDLAGGTLPKANPDSYSYESSAITLNQPIQPGYAFIGWTGSNGSTPQTTVTIPSGSHGNKSYTANWMPLWGQDKGATGQDEAHAYIISSREGLDMLAKIVNGADGYTCNPFLREYFKLGDDITYDGQENNYTPIGTKQNRFQGTFDGDGHAVRGIHINGKKDYLGIFGYIYDGRVKNVTLQNSTIIGRDDVGGIVGEIEYGSVSGCHVERTVTIGSSAENSTNHGGVVGYLLSCVIDNCTSAAQLTNNGWGGCSHSGGVVGLPNLSTVQNCLALNATVDVSGSRTKGAVIGRKDKATFINNHYFNCTVGGVTTNIGTDEGDCEGVRSIHALALPAKVTASGESRNVGGVTYYASNTTVTLNAEGYTISSASYNDGTEHEITPTAGACSFTMPAADATVSASLTAIPWSGSGTEADPWIILYPSQLDLLATRVNSGYIGYGKYYKLGADIAYDPEDIDSSGGNYTPIGIGNSTSRTFGGFFDGDGHRISGIRINNGTLFQGLFGIMETEGKVKNVTLANTVIIANSNAGGIVGRNYGTIENCHVESDVSILAYSDKTWLLGGIAGDNDMGTIYGCTSSATVSNNGHSECRRYGGIAGQARTIHNSLVLAADISANVFFGAIAGAENNSSFNLSNNYYSSCTVNGTANAENVGYRTGDVSNRDGAVRAIAYDTKPAEIGAQVKTYPFGGLTVYEHGIYYKGKYYCRHDLAGSAAALTLVQGTKDGVTAWWGTFYDGTRSYELSEGAAAYTMDAENQLYRLGKDGCTIPAGKAVIILSTTPDAFLVPVDNATAADNAPGGSILWGGPATVTDGKVDGRTPYVMGVMNGFVDFYKFTGSSIPSGKAFYLKYESK